MKKIVLFVYMLVSGVILLAPPLDRDLKKSIEERAIKAYYDAKIMASVKVQFNKFIEHLALKESNNNWKIVNKEGCIGKYQFHYKTLAALGYNITPEEFKANPNIFPVELQEKVLNKLIDINSKYLKKFDKYIGTTVNGIKITKAGLIAAAHLGGVGSVNSYFNHGHNAHDSNGTSIQHYLQEFSQFNI